MSTTLLTETFTGANGADWDASHWTIAADNAAADIQSNAGRVRTSTDTPADAGYVDAIATTADFTDGEVLMSFRWADTAVVNFIVMTFRGNSQWTATGYRPKGGLALQFENDNRSSTMQAYVADVATQVASKSITTLGTAKQWVRFRVQGTTLYAKSWPDVVAEPADWLYQGTNTTVTAAGKFMLSIHTGTATTTTHTVTIDDLTVTSFDVVNVPPTANAGPDQDVTSGSVVTLNGSASSDPDGVIAGYVWRQISGPTVTLSGVNAVKPTFAAPVDTDPSLLVFGLIVTDNGGASSTEDAVAVSVAAAVADEYASNGSGQWLPCIEYASDGSGSWT